MAAVKSSVADQPRETKQLSFDMGLWREGLAPMPKAYIEYHEKLARQELDSLVARYGITVHRAFMEDGGWMDGMRELNVIIETKTRKLQRLIWHDGNRGFMMRCRSGYGAASLSEEDLA